MLGTRGIEIDETAKHEDDEDEIVETGKGLGEAFIVACQAAEAGSPGEAALNDPATREEDESLASFR